MAAITLKSLFLWISNLLLPFVIYLASPERLKQQVREKVELFTQNAQLFYLTVLCLWVIVNLLLLWLKWEKDNEAVKIKKIERQTAEIELQIKEEELKRLKDENN